MCVWQILKRVEVFVNYTTQRGSHSVLLLTVTRSILVAGVVPRHNSATWWRTLTLPLQSHHEPFSSRSFASSCFVFLSSLMWRHNLVKGNQKSHISSYNTKQWLPVRSPFSSLCLDWVGDNIDGWMEFYSIFFFFFQTACCGLSKTKWNFPDTAH